MNRESSAFSRGECQILRRKNSKFFLTKHCFVCYNISIDRDGVNIVYRYIIDYDVKEKEVTVGSIVATSIGSLYKYCVIKERANGNVDVQCLSDGEIYKNILKTVFGVKFSMGQEME